MTRATSTRRRGSNFEPGGASPALPPDWGAAAAMLRSMDNTAGRSGKAYLRALTAFLAGVALGGVPSLWFVGPMARVTDAGIALGIMSAILAFGGLLVGFVASLMLFSGRIDDPARLTLELAVAYRARLRFILASQASTLVAALVLCVLCVAWMVFFAIGAPTISREILGVAVFAYAGVCVLRMLLLPMQIFELHEESLDAVVSRLERDAAEKYAPVLEENQSP